MNPEADNFSQFMQQQMATMSRYLQDCRQQGDTRDDNVIHIEWVRRHAAEFRARWDAGSQ